MAKYIIDTHTLIWFLTDYNKLRIEQKKAFKEVNAQFYIITKVFEESSRKFDKIKINSFYRKTIKIPPIIVWRIAKKCKNVKIFWLNNNQINQWIRKQPQLKEINSDDRPFVVLQLILQERHPKTEIRIISCDEKLRRHPLTKTI